MKQFGRIERIDMVNKETSKKVFVHFQHWFKTPEITNMRQQLDSGERVKVVYHEPWYWLLANSKVPKPEFNKTSYIKTSKKKTSSNVNWNKKVSTSHKKHNKTMKLKDVKEMSGSSYFQVLQEEEEHQEQETPSVSKQETTEDETYKQLEEMREMVKLLKKKFNNLPDNICKKILGYLTLTPEEDKPRQEEKTKKYEELSESVKDKALTLQKPKLERSVFPVCDTNMNWADECEKMQDSPKVQVTKKSYKDCLI